MLEFARFICDEGTLMLCICLVGDIGVGWVQVEVINFFFRTPVDNEGEFLYIYRDVCYISALNVNAILPNNVV